VKGGSTIGAAAWSRHPQDGAPAAQPSRNAALATVPSNRSPRQGTPLNIGAELLGTTAKKE